MASTTKGRESNGPFNDTISDQGADAAMLKKQDEIIDLLKSLTAKLDADAGVTDTDYASSLTDALTKVALQ